MSSRRSKSNYTSSSSESEDNYKKCSKNRRNMVSDSESDSEAELDSEIRRLQELKEQFEKVHGKHNIINECLKLLDIKNKNKFEEYLNQKKISQLNMFITNKYFFNKYCEEIFPWLEKCLKFFLEEKLCNDYNIRLPAFLAERFTSYWFYTNTKVNYLSYGRIGGFMLSNKINSFFNPAKLPFTFRMYPTIHDY